MKYTIVAGTNRSDAYNDLTQAISCFFQKSSEMTSETVEFYENNRLLLTWVRGKGIIQKPRVSRLKPRA